MSKQKYCELIDHICKHFHINDSKSLYDGCQIQIDDVSFTLLHGDFVNDDSLMIYCDFGMIPTEKKQSVLENLMEVNLVTAGNGAPGFGCNPETGHVMMIRLLPLSQTKSGALVSTLEEMAAYALGWRTNYFLAPLEMARSSTDNYVQA